jgi:hypothetical protein
MRMLDKRVFRVAVATVATLLLASGVSPVQSSGKILEVAESVDICPGIDESKVDKVDILILLDNSSSLKTSDPERQRFVAIKQLFESISSGINGTNTDSKLSVDIEIMTFAQTAKTLKLENIDINNPKKISDEIDRKLPDNGQQGGTNFINALDAARENLSHPSKNGNCKFLIWFTDGSFAYAKQSDKSDTENRKLKKDKLAELKSGICSTQGWAEQLRGSNVNTYVVLLGDPEILEKDENFQISLDLMAQITGDRTTSELGDVNECPDKTAPVVGEIFSVGTKDIDKLGPIFQKIGVSITGGVVMLCPTSDEPIVITSGLPNSKFFRSISLISLGLNPLPKIEDVNIIKKTGEKAPITAVFDGASAGSEGETQFDFTKTASNTLAHLEKGWKIELSANSPDFCLMATFIESPSVKITKVGNNPVQIIDKSNILSSEEISQLAYFLREEVGTTEENVTPEFLAEQKIDAGFLSRLRGELNIEADPSNPLFPKKFAVKVLVGDPIPDIQKCLAPFVFQSERTPTTGDTPGNKNFKTVECEINTLNQPESNNVTIEINDLINALKSSVGCDVIEPSLLINGESKGNSYILPVNQSATVAVNFKVGDKSTNCNLVEIDGVGFSYGDPSQTELAKFTAVYDLKQPPPKWPVIIVSFVAVLVAMLLSLLLLRYISSLFSVMPKDVYSYEKVIDIGPAALAGLKIEIDGVDLSTFKPSASDLHRPLESSSKSVLRLQSIQLERRLSRFFNPFSHVKAIVPKASRAIYWQQSGSGGLAVPFKRAIILSDSTRQSASAEKVSAQLTVLVPSKGADGGINGVEQLIRSQKFLNACKEFQERLTSSPISSEQQSSSPLTPNVPKIVGPPPIAPVKD